MVVLGLVLKNEWRSCRMHTTAYWITSMQHEGIDVEFAYPMPLAMSRLFLMTGGAWR